MREMEYLANSQMIVHAGGLGERWRPVDGERPKPLTPVGKKPRPMFEWVILPWLAADVKKIFITTWHKTEAIDAYCKDLQQRTKIDFKLITEPEKRRFGRAGAIKFGLERGILDEKRPLISMNASDIIKVDIPRLIAFHLQGVKEGYPLTVVGANMLPCQFGVISITSKRRVKNFIEKPLIKLKNQFINTGLILMDSQLSRFFKEIREKDLPLNLEDTFNPAIRKLWLRARVYLKAIPWKNWIYLKDLKDYGRVNKIDIEKFLGISAKKYLG